MKARILTALLLMPGVIILTLSEKTVWFALMLLLFMVLGMIELCRMNKLNHVQTSVVCMLFISIVSALYFVSDEVLGIIASLALLYWLWQAVELWRQRSIKSSAWRFVFEGFLLIMSAVLAFVLLHRASESGPYYALALLFIVWAADSSAFFVGKAIGRKKLAPAISPGKTVEGLIGGLAGGIFIALIASHLFFHFDVSHHLLGWLLTAMAAIFMSVVGDLYISRQKRLAGIKDSGRLLPGHGGILDRVDGLIAAAPTFVIMLTVFDLR